MPTEKFKTFTASMIAVVTVVSAMVTWRAAMAAQAAGDADFDGLVATVNGEEATVLSTIKVAEHYQAFISYTRYNELGNKLYDALQNSSSGKSQLEQQKSDSWGIAFGLQSMFFPSRYLLPDGTYDSRREMDELLADEQRARDTRSELHFDEGSQLRRKSNLLVNMLILLGTSFWFFTLAQIIDHKLRILLAGVGGFLLVIGAFAALFIEILM
jgi:hypothetical protein